MSSPDLNEAETKWLGFFSWERCALQSLRVRLLILMFVALGIQALVWALWTRNESPAMNDFAAWTTEEVTVAEFELASAMIAQAQHLNDWAEQVAYSPATSSDVWLDMALEAQRLGLTVLEPQDAMVLVDSGLEESVSSWVVKGPFSASMQWVIHLSIQYPYLTMKSFNIQHAEDGGHILLKVLWRSPEKESVVSNTPSTSLKTKLETLQHWQKTQHALLQLQTWPSFEGLDLPLGLSSMPALWPESWSLEWRHNRRHVLAQTPLSDMKWKGVLMSRGKAVALVEAGSEVWAVELGDSIGRGHYRVVKILENHMVMQKSIHGPQGHFEFVERVLGAFAEKGAQ